MCNENYIMNNNAGIEDSNRLNFMTTIGAKKEINQINRSLSSRPPLVILKKNFKRYKSSTMDVDLAYALGFASKKSVLIKFGLLY